jgi:hypothetical protein
MFIALTHCLSHRSKVAYVRSFQFGRRRIRHNFAVASDYFLDERSNMLQRLAQRDWINNGLLQVLMTDSKARHKE